MDLCERVHVEKTTRNPGLVGSDHNQVTGMV